MKLKLNQNQRVFFTSDTHYNHTNICEGVSNWGPESYKRQFQTLDQMNAVLVNNINTFVQPNDILICTRNGSQRLIGKSVIINDDEVMTFGAFMSVYRSKYNRFIAYLMQTPWFFEQVQMNLGARINQITTGTLNEFTFDFPCLEEQTKIANFLSAIDQKIDVVSEQLEQAKLWKKGLLQQMFV